MEAGAYSKQDPSQVPSHPAVDAFRDLPRIRNGWTTFAGCYLVLAGLLELIWSLTAFWNRRYFDAGDLLLSSLTVLAWVALLAAAVEILTGVLILARKLEGVLLAMGVSMFGLVTSFLSIGAYPLWSIVTMACNGLVLWAVTAHGREFT